MSHTIPANLDEDVSGFIDEQVASGRYSSGGEVIVAGLRLLEHELQQEA